MPILLLTRPAPACRRFLDALDPAAVAPAQVVIAPLLEIVPLAPAPGFSGIGRTGIGGVIFTSANGVAAARALDPAPGLPAWCVGAGTTAAAARAGWRAVQMGDCAQELIARLPAHLAARPGANRQDSPVSEPILHLAGRHRRGDVAGRLRAAGLDVRVVEIYDQRLCPLTAEARAALAGRAPVVVPLFSPRSARQFADQHRGSAPLHLVAISAAAAEPLKSLPFSDLTICPAPTLAAMLTATARALAAASRLEGAPGAD